MIPAMRDPADTADLRAVPLGSAEPLGSAVPPEPGPSLGGTAFAAGPLDASDFGEAGLPRRVRQASLAPQLRDTAAEQAPAQAADDFWTRSPEETRSTVMAIQQGWERGRSVFDMPPTGPAGSEPSAATEKGTGNGTDGEAENGASAIPGPDAGTASAVPGPDAGTASAVPGPDAGTASAMPGPDAGTASAMPGPDPGTAGATGPQQATEDGGTGG
jgi:hypothetical protein